jgi:hypothetical protein
MSRSKKKDTFIVPQNDAYDALESDWQSQAQLIIHQRFPQKILHLHALLQSCEHFQPADVRIDARAFAQRVADAAAVVDAAAPSNGRKKRKLSNTMDSAASDSESDSSSDESATSTPLTVPMPCNARIIAGIELLKAEYNELIDMIGVVKIWIQLNIPKIEDGGNFGVSIQEETVGELGRAEDSCFGNLESIGKYFLTRANLATRALKFPRVSDFTHSLAGTLFFLSSICSNAFFFSDSLSASICAELDERQYAILRMSCTDLRNNYIMLHDMILKNMEKIKQPRSTDHYNSVM